MTVEGTDLSHWNTHPDVDPYKFVIHKATQGDYQVDPLCRDRQDEYTSAGKLWGTYHFFDPRIPPAHQAEYYAAHANVVEGDILAVDFEYQEYWHPYEPRFIASQCHLLMEELEEKFPWNRILLYCNRSDYGVYITRYNVSHGDGMWIASPGRIPTMDWLIWQYGAGRIDYDRAIFDTVEDMKRWTRDKGRPYHNLQQELLVKE